MGWRLTDENEAPNPWHGTFNCHLGKITKDGIIPGGKRRNGRSDADYSARPPYVAPDAQDPIKPHPFAYGIYNRSGIKRSIEQGAGFHLMRSKFGSSPFHSGDTTCLRVIAVSTGFTRHTWGTCRDGEDQTSIQQLCCRHTLAGLPQPRERNSRPPSHTFGLWTILVRTSSWRRRFCGAVCGARLPPGVRVRTWTAGGARIDGVATNSGGSTAGGWTNTRACAALAHGPLGDHQRRPQRLPAEGQGHPPAREGPPRPGPALPGAQRCAAPLEEPRATRGQAHWLLLDPWRLLHAHVCPGADVACGRHHRLCAPGAAGQDRDG